tara:strand:+ start:394 stop:1170 length:777 start_codon:yes stop_codon:yes gene_type:complete
MVEYKNELKKNGFCIVSKLFSDQEIVSTRKALWDVIQGKYNTGREPEERFWNVGDDPENIIKIDKPHLSNNIIKKLITSSKLGKCLAEITKSNKIQVWHSQSVWKPPGGSKKGNAGWHRDIQYWPFWEPGGVFTAWIALTDVHKNSGPVRFILGSHKWSNIKGLDFFDKDIILQNKIIHTHTKDFKIKSSIINKGQLSIHNSGIYHSSNENKTDKPRVGMVVHFSTDKAKTISVAGGLSNYLENNLNDKDICPIIYEK